jgi:transketolase
VIIATGSEVELALKAQAALEAEGIPVRVVSMPSTNVFDRQDAAYRERAAAGVPRVAIEAGVTDGWYKYVGAGRRRHRPRPLRRIRPGRQLFKEFGFTAGTS